MCVILVKEKGKALPSKATLKDCWNTNRDGAGMMYVDNGKVVIDKGYMRFDDFYKNLINLDKKLNFKDKNLVLHFRISTSGNVDSENCHPYPLSNKQTDLRAKHITTDIGIAHNGMIKGFTPDRNSVLNDTQLFIKNFLKPLYDLNNTFYKEKQWCDNIENLTNVGFYSKFAILDKDDNLIRLGLWYTHNNLHCSNKHWLKSKAVTSESRQISLWKSEDDEKLEQATDRDFGDYIEHLKEMDNNDVFDIVYCNNITLEDTENNVYNDVIDNLVEVDDDMIMMSIDGMTIYNSEQKELSQNEEYMYDAYGDDIDGYDLYIVNRRERTANLIDTISMT